MKGGSVLSDRFELPAALAVLHCSSVSQTLAEAAIALAANVDGLFLINHDSSLALLKECYEALRGEVGTDVFLGVNLLLSRRPLDLWPEINRGFPGVDAVWVDDCFVHNPRVLEMLAKQRGGFKGLYFGGVAFKHATLVHPDQDAEEFGLECRKALQAAAMRAKNAGVDVVLTSGTTTGKCPSRAKVRAMHEVCQPFGVSGFGLEEGEGEVFLCATQISRQCPKHAIQDACAESFCHFDPELVKRWVEVVKGNNGFTS